VPKHGLLGWRPGPGKLGQKGKNISPFFRFHSAFNGEVEYFVLTVKTGLEKSCCAGKVRDAFRTFHASLEWKTFIITRVVHGTYLSVPFPSYSNLCLSHPMGRFPWDSHRNDIPMDNPRLVHGIYLSVPFPSHSNLL